MVNKMKKKIIHFYQYAALWTALSIALPVYAETAAIDNSPPANTVITIPAYETCTGTPWPDITWIHIHDNEETARRTALITLNQIQQGCLLDLRHGGSREIIISNQQFSFHFDPNRIFTASGRKAALKCSKGNCALILQQLSEAAENFLQQYLSQKKLIIAVHNTHTAGLSVRNYMPGNSMAQDVSQIAISPDKNPHDFFYVTSAQAFNFFASHNFNVVLQNNQTVRDDGSLSVWAAQRQIDYINAEAEMGHTTDQLAMLAAVCAYMKKFYL